MGASIAATAVHDPWAWARVVWLRQVLLRVGRTFCPAPWRRTRSWPVDFAPIWRRATVRSYGATLTPDAALAAKTHSFGLGGCSVDTR